MSDLGFNLTMRAVRRQLTAMPHELYLIRLIHGKTRRAFPGERLWTAAQLLCPATIRFLRIRNREGCDVYIHLYAEKCNPGYILVDLDHGNPAIIATMRAAGHEPCLVLQTSPGNLQAWVHVSSTPIAAALASQIGKQLAQLYGGDPASTDWRHLGRLAGFTNQKPQRRDWRGYSPWVKILHAHTGLASQSGAVLETAEHHLAAHSSLTLPNTSRPWPAPSAGAGTDRLAGSTTGAETANIYAGWLHRLRILVRFPQPDWSIADKWIAKELLWRGTPAPHVADVLRCGSPGFPRQHSNPDDYLRRTLARATRELAVSPFPGRDLLFHRGGPSHAPGV